jgi:multicomponent K+:H+ antiporter subunit A
MIQLVVILPFIGSLIAAFLPANSHKDARSSEAWLSAAVAMIGLVITAMLYSSMNNAGVVQQQWSWLPQYGLNISFRMDGLAWLFALLIQGIGLLVILYARYYMSPKDPVPRFFSFLLAFMGAMLGLVLSGNIIQLAIFWELTSIISFLLIGYWHHRIDARRGAQMAFVVTAAGGLCLLAGMVILGQIVGSYELDVVLASGEMVQAHRLYNVVLVLIVVGALTKSAQFPFHFWLPHAMAAPTPVSAYLHSATMVKAGVFLLTRFWPVLAGTDEWFWLVGGAGVCTMLLGAFFAIFQSDLKGLLAYSTISHLGLVTVLLGMGTTAGVVAAIFHMMNHAIFKASLFMAVGIIDHEAGTRDMKILRGLRQSLPITATLAIVAGASMAGVPLLNGFLSKEMFFAESLVVGGNQHWWMSWAALLMGIFGVAYSLRFISVFFGQPTPQMPAEIHEAPRWMLLPVEFLVLLCLVVGVLPAMTVGLILQHAVQAVLGDQTPDYSLALWHGFNTPLLMSIVALIGGIALYFALCRWVKLKYTDDVPGLPKLDGAKLFDRNMFLLFRFSGWLTGRTGTQRLQSQILAILVVMVLFILALARWPQLFKEIEWTVDTWVFALMWGVGCVCAVAAAYIAKYHRLAALILISGTGIVTSLTFLWLSAPDLALTQLVVETVTTVLILLGLRWLPPRLTSEELPEELIEKSSLRARLRRSRDIIVAVVSGVLVSLVTYVMLTRPDNATISDFFLINAKPQGGGTNVVNVLLVDFRAFDTLGEITVLSIVALTVYALLRRFRPAPDSKVFPAPQTNPLDPNIHLTPAQHAEMGFMRIPAVYLRFLLPFTMLIAAYFFMRGHNMPGGGFVAGLCFAVALITQYMVGGAVWFEARFRLNAHKWLGRGLGIAALTGAGAWVLGYPYLTSHTAHVYLPVFGEVHFPSAFIFDLGVFVVVVGMAVLMLIALSHQSVRSHRVPVVNELPPEPAAADKGGNH